MFCVECGKELPIYKNGVCLPCYIQQTTFSHGPDYLDIIRCSHCQVYKYKNTWVNESFKNILQRHLHDTFSISSELENITITTNCHDHDYTIPCKITIQGKIQDKEIIQHHTITIRIRTTVCDVCSRQKGGYYEATLQLRAEKRSLTTEEIQKFNAAVELLTEQMISRGNRTLFIADTAEHEGGIDFYFSEKNAAYAIAKQIQQQFGGELKQSSKNIGMKDSKQLYRMTYLVRIPEFQIGEFAMQQNRFYQINAINDLRVHVTELSKWEQLVFTIADLQHAALFKKDEIIQDMIVVSQTDTEIQLMDQKNYKLYTIQKPKKIPIKAKIVSVAKYQDNVFLLPINDSK